MKSGDVVYFIQHFNLCRGTVKEVRRTYMDLRDVAVWNDGQWKPIAYGGNYIAIATARPTLDETVALLREKHSAEIAVMTERINLLKHIADNALEATP